MRRQVLAAAEWTRVERRRLGWPIAQLSARVEAMASDMGWEGPMLDAADLQALEAAEPRVLPRWFKLVRYAVERAAVPEGVGLAWLAERNIHWQADGPLRMSRPLLFEEEDRILRKLQKLDADEQRAIRAFVCDYADRRCYATREAMAGRLLSRLGIEMPRQTPVDGPEGDSGPCPG